MRKSLLNRVVVENLLWFLASLALAFFVWVIAIAQTDPIQERLFTQVPVLFGDPDAGLLVTNRPTNIVRVNVRAQQSVLDSLTREDITVRAQLAGLSEGTHNVELQAQTTRRATADTQPAQITVVLERIEARKVPVTATITNPPGVEFEIIGEPTFDQNQVEVSGASSKVQLVSAAQVVLDLSQQRNPLEQEIRLVPVDANGVTIEDVTVDPQTVLVTVDVRQRADIRQVSVRPQILFDTLPQGFSLSSITYEPQTVLVSGSQSALENLPDTLSTSPIDLSQRTGDFEVVIPIELPEGDLLVLDAQLISVSVGMAAQTSTRQFDSVPVTVIGLASGMTTQVAPNQVTIIITGPEPDLNALESTNIQAVVDLNGLGAGNHTLPLTVSTGQISVSSENLTVLPAVVDIVITSDAETTPEPSPPSNTN